MSHQDLFACFKAFDKAYKHIGHKNKVCLIELELDQDYWLIMSDITSLHLAPPKMDDGHV
jgi:hypothetical protein